jgi:hypothetical protein
MDCHILGNIGKAICKQEGCESLRELSQHLWLSQGYILSTKPQPVHTVLTEAALCRQLDLTALTRYPGDWKLLMEGFLNKVKSGHTLGVLL